MKIRIKLFVISVVEKKYQDQEDSLEGINKVYSFYQRFFEMSVEKCSKHKIPLSKSKTGSKFCKICVKKDFAKASMKGKRK